MRKLGLVLLCIAAACGGAAMNSDGSPAGAVGPREAVEQFLATVRSKDIQKMSLIWGTSSGPVRDRMERNEMEKREILLQCYLKHDAFKVLDDNRSDDGKVKFRVELTQSGQKKTTTFVAVKGPGDRWFMEDADITVMQDFCTGR